MRPLRPDTLGGRHHVVQRAVGDETRKPNLAGFWVCIGDFVDVGDPGNDPACTSPSSPPYENAWTPPGVGPYADPAFRHGLDGLLEFKGVPADGAFGTVLTTLPAEWRPDTDTTFFRDVLIGSVLVPSRWVVDASTGEVTIYAFSSGGGAGEWCRLGFDTDYTVPISTGPNRVLDFDLEANHDPSFYDIVNASAGGTRNAIQILEDGVYAVTWGIYLDVFTPLIPTNTDIYFWFSHTTWTHENEGYFYSLDLTLINNLASPILSGSKVFRSGPDFDPVFMGVTVASIGSGGATPDSDLGIIGGDLNISYMEIVRLNGAAAGQTDPNDSITGP